MSALLVAAGLLGLAAVGLLAARRRLLLVTVDGDSMTPALHDGDRVLVRRAGIGQVRRGEVVIVERPGDDGRWTSPGPARRRLMVKRIGAVPGDPVPAHLGPALAALRGPVPEGCLVVLGDRAEGSFDSRFIGYVPADRLVGVVRWSLRAARPGR
ncbi:S26 family signal peptidase [Couchioplanes azureus]|uniref:S26 family signal peptidase n=1 Tax=Couchioplanes caeruleus TaxID=56438 RepID=UPI00166F7489|nr:S26 family signal peptidase [Couchioplanes caeruleus]GGQ75144.1 S26 family signal peptidase [Couchioplanes caeruleus subsp. azureus]